MLLQALGEELEFSGEGLGPAPPPSAPEGLHETFEFFHLMDSLFKNCHIRHIQHWQYTIGFSIFNFLVVVVIWAAERRDAARETESRNEKPFHLCNN